MTGSHSYVNPSSIVNLFFSASKIGVVMLFLRLCDYAYPIDFPLNVPPVDLMGDGKMANPLVDNQRQLENNPVMSRLHK